MEATQMIEALGSMTYCIAGVLSGCMCVLGMMSKW